MANIYYVQIAEDDEDWYSNGPRDNRFFASRESAQRFADELNEAENEKYREHRDKAYGRWMATESLIRQIKDQIDVDVTPLIPYHSSEFSDTYNAWQDSFEVVEVELED